jgi:hypothetical protein
MITNTCPKLGTGTGDPDAWGGTVVNASSVAAARRRPRKVRAVIANLLGSGDPDRSRSPDNGATRVRATSKSADFNGGLGTATGHRAKYLVVMAVVAAGRDFPPSLGFVEGRQSVGHQ